MSINKRQAAINTQVYTQNLVASGIAKQFVPLGVNATTFNMSRVEAEQQKMIIHIDISGTGPAGERGPQGIQGIQGPQGIQGLMGLAGLPGVRGAVGAVGPVGPVGPAGAVGPQGSQGPQGPQGTIGPQGAIGPAGAIGPEGPQGPQGSQGPAGNDGAVGPKGDAGADGEAGPQGPAGANGANGADGTNGADGAAGADGANGADGAIGPQGEVGATGPQGAGGGLVYFLNYNNRTVSKTFSVIGQAYTYYLAEQTSNTNASFSYTLPGGIGPYPVPLTGATDNQIFMQFILAPDTVTNNFIPGGIWNMNIYASCTSDTFARNYISWDLYYNTESGDSGSYTLIKLASSSQRFLTGKTAREYRIDAAVSTRFLTSTNKQLFVRINVGASVASSDPITFYFSSTQPTNIQTSIPLLGAKGDIGTSYFSIQPSSTNIYYDSGNVAIKKTSAAYPLDVAGSINASGTYLINGANLLLDTPLLGNATATTQDISDNSTRVATTAYVQGRISALIGGADGALDTLNELAQALNNDAAFSTTVTTSLASKASISYVDLSVNSVLASYYIRSVADSSINSVLDKYYTKTDTDLSINSVLKTYITTTTLTNSYYTQFAIDNSMNANFYNKTTIDNSMNASFYNKTTIDNSMNASFYNKTTIDNSMNANFYNKTTIDNSMNANFYNKTTIDNSMNTNFYNKTTIDNSMSTNFYNKTTIDNSMSTNFYNKTTIDNSMSTNFYNKTTIDNSINSILESYYRKDVIDASINGNIYNKTTIDASINSILGSYTTSFFMNARFNSGDLSINKIREDINSLVITGSVKDPSINDLHEYNGIQDLSISLLPTKGLVDASLALYYLKTDIDASINGNIYNKTTIDASINSILGSYYTKDVIDASINGNIYNKTTIDASINSILGSYYTKDVIDASINGNIYNKTTIDASINSILGSYYTKDVIDASINGNIYNKTTIDNSMNASFYNKTTIDNSMNASFYNKTTIDSSINSILGSYYTKDVIDASINGNIYNKTTIDNSMNASFYNKTTIDNSMSTNFYNKTTIDNSMNASFYNKTTIDNSMSTNFYNKTTIDNSMNASFYNKTTIDNSMSTNFYNKTTIDNSMNASFYNKTTIDNSMNASFYNKTTIDNSMSTNFYNKTTIDNSMNASFYNKTTIDNSMNASFYNKTTIDNSMSTNFYNKTTIDNSMNTSFYNKTTIDNSMNASFYNKTTIDNSMSTNFYNKTTIDNSINSVLLNYASRLTDVSFVGNIQLGTTRTISVGINKTPSTAYALDISGDLDVNGNVYLGMGTNFVGINTINPVYHLDVSGTLNARSIRVNGTEIGGSIPGYSANTFSFDTSFNGNVQVGSATSLRSFGINCSPNPSYALDVSGTLNARSILVNGAAIGGSIPGYSANTFSFDTSFNGNIQIGNTTLSRSLGINRTADPLYSLDISGDVRIIETGPGTLASATTGTLVLSHTTSGRSSITFTSPNAGGDYGYIQYYDNNNPSTLVTETSGGLMVIGVENRDGSGNTSDRISLYADAGTGNVGVNTLSPEYHLDVSGTLRYSAVSENLVPTTTTSNIINIVYGTGSGDINGMIRYITTVAGDLTLNISNLPLITNRSYVFTIIYNGGATTNYIKTVNLAFAGVTTFTTITPKGTVTALTSTTFFIQQFYVFIVSATMTSNIVFQTLTS